jgi:hypothetical protein
MLDVLSPTVPQKYISLKTMTLTEKPNGKIQGKTIHTTSF